MSKLNHATREPTNLDRTGIALIVIAALAVRLFLAFFNLNEQVYDDLYNFVLPWMKHFSEYGILRMYDTSVEGAMWGVDYPPLYYTVMYFTVGWIAVKFEALGLLRLAYFTLRLFPIALDCMMVYILARKNKTVGWMWAFAIPAIIDTGMMGQSDTILMLEAFLLIYAFREHKSPIVISVVFAVMACTKLQGLYFLPVFLTMMAIGDYPVKDKVRGFGFGVLTGIVIWLPWLIENGIEVFFRVYLGGYGNLNRIAANTSNLYFLSGCSILPNEMVSPMYEIVSYSLIAICAFVFVWLVKKTGNIEFSTFVYLYLIYMITFQQKERYEIYAFCMLLICLLWFDEMKKLVFPMYLATSAQLVAAVLWQGALEDKSMYFYVVLLMLGFGENLLTAAKLPGLYQGFVKARGDCNGKKQSN